MLRPILIALLMVGALGLADLASRTDSTQAVPTPAPAVSPLPAPRLDAEGRAYVDRWLEEKGLNFYGDPPGAIYAGGSPLLDEQSGRWTERYEHVLLRHPELTDGLTKVVEPDAIARLDAWLDARGLDALGRPVGAPAVVQSPLVDEANGTLRARPELVLALHPEALIEPDLPEDSMQPEPLPEAGETLPREEPAQEPESATPDGQSTEPEPVTGTPESQPIEDDTRIVQPQPPGDGGTSTADVPAPPTTSPPTPHPPIVEDQQ